MALNLDLTCISDWSFVVIWSSHSSSKPVGSPYWHGALPLWTECVRFSHADVLEFCVLLYLQHFSFPFVLWVCRCLLLLSFATFFSCSVFGCICFTCFCIIPVFAAFGHFQHVQSFAVHLPLSATVQNTWNSWPGLVDFILHNMTCCTHFYYIQLVHFLRQLHFLRHKDVRRSAFSDCPLSSRFSCFLFLDLLWDTASFYSFQNSFRPRLSPLRTGSLPNCRSLRLCTQRWHLSVKLLTTVLFTYTPGWLLLGFCHFCWQSALSVYFLVWAVSESVYGYEGVSL